VVEYNNKYCTTVTKLHFWQQKQLRHWHTRQVHAASLQHTYTTLSVCSVLISTTETKIKQISETTDI